MPNRIELDYVELDIRLPPIDEVALRARLRDRWMAVEYQDGFGVEHQAAGPFGCLKSGDFAPLRFATREEANAWIDAVIDDPRNHGLIFPVQ